MGTPIITENNGKLSTKFAEGNPGRPQGAKNHLSQTVREVVLSVFNTLQGDKKASLEAFAKKYPRDFYQIAAKLIPTEITGSLKKVITVTDIDE